MYNSENEQSSRKKVLRSNKREGKNEWRRPIEKKKGKEIEEAAGSNRKKSMEEKKSGAIKMGEAPEKPWTISKIPFVPSELKNIVD